MQSVLVGERALGMGGAFTGMADDPSAAFYNPAGLAHLESAALSASLNVYSFDHYSVDDAYGSPIGTASFVHDSNPTLPIFVSAVGKLGHRDELDIRPHAFALSTFIPIQHSRSFTADVSNASSMVSNALHIQDDDRTLWFGPSYAYRVTPRLAFGLSAFLSTRTYLHREDETNFTAGMRDAMGRFTNTTLSVRESVTSLDAKHIVLRVGGHVRLDPWWSLGLTFQPPGIPLSQSARVQERRIFADQLAMPGYSTFFSSDQGDLEASSPIPWQVRVGAAYRVRDRFTAVADVWVDGPSGSADDPVRQVGAAQPEPITGETPQPGVFVAQTFRRNVVVNAAAGIETLVAGMFPLRVGVFTNLSSAPAVAGPTDVYSPADVNLFGASVSAGFRAEGYDLSVGVAGIYGRGRGLRLNPSPGLDPTPQTFLPTDVEQRTIYITISGERRALMRLARNVYHDVTD